MSRLAFVRGSLNRQAIRLGRDSLAGSSANRAVARCALRRCRLGSANEPMMDATGKQERHPIGIDPPDQRPDAERCSVRGNEHYDPGAKSCSGHDSRAVIADVHDAAGVALCPRFDDHRPGDSSSRMLPSIFEIPD